jgi:hypothetical protein
MTMALIVANLALIFGLPSRMLRALRDDPQPIRAPVTNGASWSDDISYFGF